jgi:predicted O-methyltransferase YrrM
MINKNNISIEKFKLAPVIKGKKKIGNRLEHLKYALSKTIKIGNVLEFGVFDGTTINVISNFFKNEIVYGFDSFEGLPEKWKMSDRNIFEVGHFSVTNLPTVNENVKLIKGWFDDTLPIWIKNYKNENIKFLHIDCDLYSSTSTILNLLNNKIDTGTIIVFDDFYYWKSPLKYEFWKKGEYKALVEWITKYNREFEIISISGYMQCAIRILK